MELVLVLVLVAVLWGLALPSFKARLAAGREEQILKTLVNAVEFARREAVVEGSSISLCASLDQQHCSGSWEQGFIILKKEEVIEAFHFFHPTGRLEWKAFPQGRAYLEFRADGSTAEENGRFSFYRERSEVASWSIIISKPGRLRVIHE